MVGETKGHHLSEGSGTAPLLRLVPCSASAGRSPAGQPAESAGLRAIQSKCACDRLHRGRKQEQPALPTVLAVRIKCVSRGQKKIPRTGAAGNRWPTDGILITELKKHGKNCFINRSRETTVYMFLKYHHHIYRKWTPSPDCNAITHCLPGRQANL